MRLKSHESPRHQGRNDRGRGGTARKRQIDKRNRALIQRLKANRSQNGAAQKGKGDLGSTRGPADNLYDPVLQLPLPIGYSLDFKTLTL